MTLLLIPWPEAVWWQIHALHSTDAAGASEIRLRERQVQDSKFNIQY
jgi:hypothetical protein